MAFTFPDNPDNYETVTNSLTGSTYQWRDDLTKWVVVQSNATSKDFIWEGDSPPDPIGDYKLWYSTDTLELYFHFCDVNSNCAWVPTAAPLTVLDGLRTDLNAALSVAKRADGQSQANTNMIQVLDQAINELEENMEDVNLENVLTNSNYADKAIFLTDGTDTLIEISPEEDLIGIASDLGSVNPRFRMTHIDKFGYPDAHVQWELANSGTTSNFQFNEHVTDVNFEFDDQAKLILTKDDGALFTDAVKAGSTEALAFMAVKDNDVATKKYVDTRCQNIFTYSFSGFNHGDPATLEQADLLKGQFYLRGGPNESTFAYFHEQALEGKLLSLPTHGSSDASIAITIFEQGLTYPLDKSHKKRNQMVGRKKAIDTQLK